jgi:hypothetical protein
MTIIYLFLLSLCAIVIKSTLHFGVPEGNRTPDPRFRKPVLYPAELPGLDQTARAAGVLPQERGRRERKTH